MLSNILGTVMEEESTPEPPKPLSRSEKRKLKRLEKRQKKLEKQREEERNRLRREIRYTTKTVTAVQADWQRMLEKAALPRFRKDLEIIWHTFERAVDSKDYHIGTLLEELRRADDQYLHNFRSHTEAMECLGAFFTQRLKELNSDFEASTQMVTDLAAKEAASLNAKSQEQEERFRTMMYMMALNRKDEERILRSMHFGRMDEDQTKYAAKLDRVKGGLDLQYAKIYGNTVAFVQEFKRSTMQRKQEHDTMKATDDSMQALIKRQISQIANSAYIIKHLKQELQDRRTIMNRELAGLQNDRNYYSDSLTKLRAEMVDDRAANYLKLGLMSELGNSTCDYLEKLIEKGERIMGLSTICRKFETQKEKILPFPEYAVFDSEQNAVTGSKLAMFWQRVGQVTVLKHNLNEELDALIRENSQLKQAISHYTQKIGSETITCAKFRRFPTIPKCDLGEIDKRYQMFRH